MRRRGQGTAATESWRLRRRTRRSETPRGRRPRSPRPSQKHKQTRTHVVVTLKSLRRDRVRTHALSGQVRVANDRRERGLQFHHQSVAAKNENWWFDTARARARRVMLKHPGGGTGPGTSRSLRRWKVRKSEGEKEERDSDKNHPHAPHTTATTLPPNPRNQYSNKHRNRLSTSDVKVWRKERVLSSPWKYCYEKGWENCSDFRGLWSSLFTPDTRGPPNLQHSHSLFNTKP